ncbi:hypothetical protein CYLTODRAFT_487158 [Cylindrobasidium torrendii FP15055 ss-10]|uniref:Uncharacterized protein n=1 Tax=Cylindrobasidium torrendii FP15055 ss-10 TaxID=1314674 RepID=A0A0D7BLW8_9AGAR|nr:hypothetical protein CYLTODRAFT_487158 [Cylindrobasidium torrendii FP15055 ss-10]
MLPFTRAGAIYVSLVLLVLGLPQAVAAKWKFRFKFDNVTQCEPVSISFRGSKVPDDSIPVALTLLPLDGLPTTINIPNAAVNSSGVYVTFFPLAAGTQFIASLDNMEGESAARVSDVFKVLDSDDTSCLPTTTGSEVTPSPFTVQDPLEQCGNLTVAYNTTTAPSVRIFQPRGGSLTLNQTSDDPKAKVATYPMVAFRQSDIVLLFEGGDNQTFTSDLLPVGGDVSSSADCFPPQWFNITDEGKPSDTATQTGAKTTLSRQTIIGISVSCGLVGLIALLVALYMIRERRVRRRRMFMVNGSSGYPSETDGRQSYGSTEKVLPRAAPPPINTGSSFGPTGYPEGFVQNPAYATAQYTPSARSFVRDSLASWGNKIGSLSPKSRGMSISSKRTDSGLPPLDIEGMLNMASTEQSNPVRTPTTASSYGVQIEVPPFDMEEVRGAKETRTPLTASSVGGSEFPAPYSPPRAHLRPGADVPTSMTLSAFFPSGVASRPVSNFSTTLASEIGAGSSVRGLPASPRTHVRQMSSVDSTMSGGVRQPTRLRSDRQ